MKQITTNTIEQDTQILSWLIAETVAEAYVREYYKTQIDNWKNLSEVEQKKLNDTTDEATKKIAEYLDERANTHYQYSESYNKGVKAKGNKGRDYVYLFMYHWLGMDMNGKFVQVKQWRKDYKKIIEEWEALKELNK